MPSLLIAFIATLILAVAAYVPSLPTNSTKDAIAGGLNITDVSRLRLQWFSNGSYIEHVSYQLAGNGSTGISNGVLVHFSEDKASNLTPPTNTPWIALVSCDKNATDASMEEDIFTLARDKGAVSALLYSLYSAACIINPEYADPATFDQVFDIFSTQSLTSAHLIEYQFGQLGPQNNSIFSYDSQQLNNSASYIQKSIDMGYPVSSGYLLAVLQAYNATDPTTSPSNPGGNSADTHSAAGSSPNTALAMIILYAITGCVSALFCIVIISGAIRAIRHPERYGPRARMGNNGGPPQSRARGLTRAILDTFPIVKFGSDPNATTINTFTDKDPENQEGPALAMKSYFSSEISPQISPSEGEIPGAAPSQFNPSNSHLEGIQEVSTQLDLPLSLSQVGPPSSRRRSSDGRSSDVGEGSSSNIPSDRPVREDVVPASIGHETCPICIVDFEEGDDIRLLPCEGKHSFHQTCVDPWLLKLSSSCPICRHDFLALEHMLAGHPDDEAEEEEGHRMSTTRASQGGRFSRYLRFAHRRQHRQRGQEHDTTDPYMPTAPNTSMYPGM